MVRVITLLAFCIVATVTAYSIAEVVTQCYNNSESMGACDQLVLRCSGVNEESCTNSTVYDNRGSNGNARMRCIGNQQGPMAAQMLPNGCGAEKRWVGAPCVWVDPNCNAPAGDANDPTKWNNTGFGMNRETCDAHPDCNKPIPPQNRPGTTDHLHPVPAIEAVQ